MSIRIAVIGTGIMGADHARIIAEDLPGAKLQVVCDIDESQAQSVADAHDAADTGTDPEAVIARSDVDAVIVASPDFTHAPLSLACIRAGKRVLCEKPLSQSPEECSQVMQAEMDAGARFVQVGFMRRYDRSYAEMKQAIAEGTLGRPLMMHNFHRNVKTPTADFTAAMAITNSAPHEIDVARHVLNAEYKWMSAYQPRRSDDLAAPVVMVLETADRQLVTIEVNNNADYGYDVRAELVGESGSISTNNLAYTRSDMKLANSTTYDKDWRGRFADAYRAQDREFVRFAATGQFPDNAASSWDGYCAAVVAETGVRALADGRKTAIELTVKPEFYD